MPFRVKKMSEKGRRFFTTFWGTFSFNTLFILHIPGPVEMVMESMHRVIGRLTAKTNKTRLALFPASEKNILRVISIKHELSPLLPCKKLLFRRTFINFLRCCKNAEPV